MQKLLAVPFSSTLFVLAALLQVYTSPALADEVFNITDIKDCQGIQGDAERLSCYDTVSRGGVFNEQQLQQVQIEQFGGENLRKKPEPTSAEPTSAMTTEPVSTDTRDTGKKPESSTPPKTKISIDEINVTVVSVKKNNVGIHYFQTSDGQVWKQKSATRWGLEVPFDARIKKGLVGSFFLVHEGGKSTRVKRVK